jgi:hypothetical protein
MNRLWKRTFGVEVKRCKRCGNMPLGYDACEAERTWRGKAPGDEPWRTVPSQRARGLEDRPGRRVNWSCSEG